MKCKVLIDFIDKETKAFNKAGSIINLSDSRTKEILAVGQYIEPLEDAEEATKKAEPKKKAATKKG